MTYFEQLQCITTKLIEAKVGLLDTRGSTLVSAIEIPYTVYLKCVTSDTPKTLRFSILQRQF